MGKKKLKDASIVIRGKNESHWLKILFRTLKSQKFKNYEIIYCDNKSSDSSIDLAKKYKIQKIINFKKYLPGRILNQAILKSNSKYIIFLSSHCVPTNDDWLSSLVNFMKKNTKVIASYGRQIPLPGTSTKDKLDLSIIFRDEDFISSKDPYLNNANSIYRADFLKKNLFNSKLTNIEDKVWALKNSNNSKKIAYNSKATVFHHHGVHQHNDDSERSSNTMKILQVKYKKFWKKCEFIKNKFFNFSMIINARQADKKQILKLKKRLDELFNNKKFNELNIENIFCFSNFKFSLKNKKIKIKFLKPKENLNDDLKKFYKSNYSKFLNINYVISFNFLGNWNANKIMSLVNYCILNSLESVTFTKKYYGNFRVFFQKNVILDSLGLKKKEDKPWILIMRWIDGCIFNPEYLKDGKYVDYNTKFLES